MIESIVVVPLALVCASFVSPVALMTYHYVTQGNDSSLCNETTIHPGSCNTLEYFARYKNTTFLSSTTFIFRQGVHLLPRDTNLTVTNVENMNFLGQNDFHRGCPVIQCQGDGGFFFANISHLSFHCLTFNECGQNMSFPPHYYPHKATLTFRIVEDLIMYQVFIHNSCGYGIYGIRIYGNSAIDNCQFANNSGTDEYIGGNAVITYEYCTDEDSEHARLIISSTAFVNGTFADSEISYANYAPGLVMYFYCSGVTVIIENVTMIGNDAYPADPYGNVSLHSRGGNLALIFNITSVSHENTVNINNCRFVSGRAKQGAGLYINYVIDPSLGDNKIWITNSSFESNSAFVDGGAIYFQIDQGITNGRGKSLNLQIENCTFFNNSVSSKSDVGIAISILGSQSSYIELTALFHNLHLSHNVLNSANGFTSSSSGVFYVKEQRGEVVVEDCIFESNNASAISLYHSYIEFRGEVIIRNNNAFKGGGLVLCEASLLILAPDLSMIIEQNSAVYAGGGIFVESPYCSQQNSLCFFQPTSKSASYNISLIYNQAEFAGTQLYGGNIEQCYLQVYGLDDHSDHFKHYFHVSFSVSDLSPISSYPIKVCFCTEYNEPNCSLPSIKYDDDVFSGEVIQFDVAVVGQQNGIVPDIVEVSLENRSVTFRTNDTQCAKLNYSLFTESSDVYVKLALNIYHKYKNNVDRKFVSVYVKRCPLGFSISKVDEHSVCVCDKVLRKTSGLTQCFIKNQTILRYPPVWIGYYWSKNSSKSMLTDGIIVHEVCPYDYCKQDSVYIESSATDFYGDSQCSYNRTGYLCGSCPPHLSSAITSSTCMDCSGYSILVSLTLSIVIAVGGVVLVIVLFLCNYTVTEGTMSGLLFYANIFAVNVSILLPDNQYRALNNFCVIFLSWLNLDPGIEVCFHHGLTEYHKIWGHFIFPVYLWMIAGLIVLLCRQYALLARLLGRNAVPVLATIFLLSYTKINQGVIKSLSYTVINFPGPNNTLVPVRVWLMDTSIEYFSGKHIALFITAIIFGMLSFLYTFFLLCIRPIRKNSHRSCLKWVNKLKPLIDAYTCPHIIEEHKQFWNGLLLLFRLLLFVIFASFEYTNPQFILCIITSFILILLMLTWSMGGVYKRWTLNLLSSSMLLNLGLLSSVTLYFLSRNADREEYTSAKLIKWRVYFSYLSILVVVITFMFITLFNFQRTLKAICGSLKCSSNCTAAMSRRPVVETDTTSSIDSESCTVDQFISVFDYREVQLGELDEK